MLRRRIIFGSIRVIYIQNISGKKKEICIIARSPYTHTNVLWPNNEKKTPSKTTLVTLGENKRQQTCTMASFLKSTSDLEAPPPSHQGGCDPDHGDYTKARRLQDSCTSLTKASIIPLCYCLMVFDYTMETNQSLL